MKKSTNEIGTHLWNSIKDKEEIFIRGKSFYLFSRDKEKFLAALKNIEDSGNFVLSWNIFENFYNWGVCIYNGRPDLLNENNGYFIRFKIILKNYHKQTAEIELDMLKKSISKYKKLDTFIEV